MPGRDQTSSFIDTLASQGRNSDMPFADRTKWAIMLARQRARLLHAYTGLTEEQLFNVKDEGGWSMADIFAHTTAWAVHTAGLLPEILNGERSDVPPVDGSAFDRSAFAEIHARGFVSVLNDLIWSRRALLQTLSAATDEAISRPRMLYGDKPISLREWAVQEQIDHEVEHAEQARAARKASNVKLSYGPKVILAAALSAAHDYFMTCVACVPAGQEAALPVTGSWTLKDVLGHVADWHATVASAADDALGGRPLSEVQFSRLQQWNEEHAAARQVQSWAAVRNDYDEAWRRVQATLEKVSEADFLLDAAQGERGPIALYPWLFIAVHHEDEHTGFLSHWIMDQG